VINTIHNLTTVVSNYVCKKLHDTGPWWLCTSSTRVEQSTHNPKFESLNPGTSVAPRERECGENAKLHHFGFVNYIFCSNETV
jgi:hypothetical protein